MKLKYYLTIFAEPKVNKIMFQFDCSNKSFYNSVVNSFCCWNHSVKKETFCISFVTILLITRINIITSHKVIIVRYDAVLDQSECMHLYDQWSNYTNSIILKQLVVSKAFSDWLLTLRICAQNNWNFLPDEINLNHLFVL